MMSRRMFGFDGAHLKAEMNSYGVFLVATCKDYNKQVTLFTLAPVLVENEGHWTWFGALVKKALGSLQAFTAVSDRMKGLIKAVELSFPQAGHRYCLVHNKRNITETRKLTSGKRNLINEMAGSDCENDFYLFFSELASTNKSAADKLAKIYKTFWVKYEFLAHNKLATYGEATSNVAEQ
ncbi:unnamed protein product [Phytophthora fragariaefolia]|uniref:Unnamed protein product n=1 Tax=Phytophthora fragariaefolia TaxID=1490495 RepID=A0A9W6U3X0_9STRA|nr:unnamed protein product [Phytophthora fragariaefolia]